MAPNRQPHAAATVGGMSRNHKIAINMIESRLNKLLAGNTSAQLHAETSMAFEMAHSLGAIDLNEYTDYVTQHNQIIERQHQDLTAKLARLSA